MSLKEKLKRSKEKKLQRLEAKDAKRREEKAAGKINQSRIKVFWKELPVGKKAIAIVLVLALVCGACYGGYRLVMTNSSSDKEMMDMNRAGMEMGQNVITASGTTTMGMVTETFDVDSLETELEIEEVYLNNGDEVAEGDKILKISEESLEEARTELQQAALDAEYAYRLGVITNQESLISAQSTYDKAIVNANYAENDYNDAVLQAQEKVDDLQAQVDEAQELVDEYTAAIENNTYYTEYDIENLKNTAYENFELLMQLYEEWGIEESGTTSTSSGSTTTYSDSLSSIYSAFAAEVEEEEQEYEEALEKYEEAMETAQSNLTKAQANLEVLNAQLTQAQVAYETSVTSAKSTYTETLSAKDTAEDTYNTSVEKANDELEALQDEMENAKENLEAFEEAISDGYMYTTTAGTIMMVNVREGDTLAADSIVIAYTDSTTISVSASVDQSYISQLEVGQSATVVFTEYGTYNGTITAINPATQSSSRSSVTYTVTVSLDGDVSELSQNLSATVYFQTEEVESEGSEENATSLETDAQMPAAEAVDEASTETSTKEE
ncbi:MAG: efflux RND transporter periplasmic adaptor subunit [Butyrivibrio sp.]|nr:efflux RND transporter periplasmic adaptor subunit [Butyrivibrio sp.]